MKRLKQMRAVSQARELAQEFGGGARVIWRFAMTLGLGALFLGLFVQRVQDFDLDQLRASVSAVPVSAWAAAAALTCLAFWAVGQYDAVLHRHFATGMDSARARRAGICAIAVSQTLGLGVITGAVLRWRMMPEQSFLLATRITVAVALSFLAGWAVVTAIVLMVLPDAPYQEVAFLVLAAAAALTLMSLLAPRARFRWPNGFTLTRLVVFCAIDTMAAALALYVLMPVPVDFAILLPAFLLAYGAGLVSGAPGGIGAFEVTLLALMPQMPDADLLTGVIAWRLVYFVLPALMGAAVAICGPAVMVPQSRAPLQLPPDQRRAETGILAQGEHGLIGQGHHATWLVGRRAHVLVGLFDPMTVIAISDYPKSGNPKFGNPTSGKLISCNPLKTLTDTAQSEARLPVIYKAGAAMAVQARRAGWITMRCAAEAVVDPLTFDLATPRRAGLRRKLRHASGVSICQNGFDWDELDAVAAEWARLHGGERGFSMGRYARDYVAGQGIYVARQAGRITGFVTWHQTRDEWTLDLMRHGTDMADGTMHLLIHQAIQDAARAGVVRLSLAAAPQMAFHKLPKFLQSRLAAGIGLRRFKDSFAPKWEGRYFLAPHWPAALMGAAAIARAVSNPHPKARRPRLFAAWQEYGFADWPAPWQRKRE